MLSVSSALKKIKESVKCLDVEKIPVSECVNRVLAEDIISLYDFPLFSQSAMDGFALNSQDTKEASAVRPVKLKIITDLSAGFTQKIKIEKLTCVKIATGAPIPEGADTVLIKEQAIVENDFLVVTSKIPKGENIRYKGEEIKKGKRILKKGRRLTITDAAIINSQGYKDVAVFKKPRLAIITTGNEVIQPGEPLKFGRVFDANLIFLKSYFETYGYNIILSIHIEDDVDKLRQVIESLEGKVDFIISAGGASVGEKDVVKSAAAKCGFEEIFWKVAQKPGKPVYFAKKDNIYFLGLPGNPAAVYICFFVYALRILDLLEGVKSPHPFYSKGILRKAVSPAKKRTLWLRCKTFIDKKARIYLEPLKAQESHIITNFAEVNAIAKILPRKNILPKGAIVDFFTYA
jgi:molybdopterin molybdotransferase